MHNEAFLVARTARRILALVMLALPTVAQAQGSITGAVLDDERRPVDRATVTALRSDRSVAAEVSTDSAGRFRLTPLAAGVYSVTARKLGHRAVEQPSIRIAIGQTVTLTVTLTRAPRQLSTIRVVTSPTSVDASSPALTVRLDRTFTELLPSARTATSLVTLVPGARTDQLWGGAPGISNDYQVDGVSMNHPGIGGDFLALSVDWIESLDIRGLGAGAEHGDFQGGVINAVTRSGANRRRSAIRSSQELASLTATNFEFDEQGVEQAGRREVAGEALGPIARDRLFYFVAGQYVARDMRSPDLSTVADDFQPTRETQRDTRGIGKLTWLPALGQRLDLLAGFSSNATGHAGINGVDFASATQRVSRPTTYAGISWRNQRSARSQMDVRLAGFTSRETRTGYAGADIPGVQLLSTGRLPRWQNSAFNQRREPSSLSGTVEWRGRPRLFAEHELALGAEHTVGRWRDQRTRNGGMTWRPYFSSASTYDPFNAATWPNAASEWGGEMFIDSDMSNSAIYVQDRVPIGARITLEPGLRYGRWSGFIRPRCDATANCNRFEAVRASGIAPRIGLAWDVTGQNTFVVKAHWGRYHQGMFALFFDRADGADVYTNQRFYHQGPVITDARTKFTPAQRDADAGFAFFEESIFNTSGRVEGYRQPFVDQTVLAMERSIGRSWKAELIVTSRVNKDMVGLVDRNRESNWTHMTNVHVDHRFVNGIVLDAHGRRLVIPKLYVSNRALLEALAVSRTGRVVPATIFGMDTASIARLTWNQDIVLTTIPDARRRYEQATLLLRADYDRWRAEGSVSRARLKGNVPGIGGFGTTSTLFTAGPFVNPNEGVNGFGLLPDALEWEGKLWATARLPFAMQGGFVFTHTYGERFTPSFELNGRYKFSQDNLEVLPSELFADSFGQQILLEQRGDRHFASRDVLDAHLQWRAPRGNIVAELDLFNVFGSNALLAIKTTVDDQAVSDPSSRFGAARQRVHPRALRIGVRLATP